MAEPVVGTGSAFVSFTTIQGAKDFVTESCAGWRDTWGPNRPAVVLAPAWIRVVSRSRPTCLVLGS